MSYLFNNKIDFVDVAKDAFNRLSISQPLTLFDSSHRYSDNNLWITGTTNGCTASFDQNQGLIKLCIGTTSGQYIVRETKKVFAYQPGKSLKILNTFVMNTPKNELRQRVGYFGDNNGVFLELDGLTLGFVKRSIVTGATVDTRIEQQSWNVDSMLGSGPSGMTLDISKAQIMWMDIEWLGVGSVRTGFIIDGKIIHCHTFNHANILDSTYMSTACLPLRYELFNKIQSIGGSTMKQICSSVISEGGYELRGSQKTIGTPVNTGGITLVNLGQSYPVVSLRLKTNRLDSVVVLSGASFLPNANNAVFKWSIVKGGDATGGSWISAGTDSSVEYNITGTTFSGGEAVVGGYVSASNQSTSSITIGRENLFKFQLERDSIGNTPYQITLIASSDSATSPKVFGSLDWEEINR